MYIYITYQMNEKKPFLFLAVKKTKAKSVKEFCPRLSYLLGHF